METLSAIIVIALMLAVNAVFACYEMALAGVSRGRLEMLLQSKRHGARSAVYMKDRLEGSLAVIQLGITMAGAIAAATGGAGVDEWLSPWLRSTFELSRGAAEALALAVFVIPLSAVTIVFAELVPKMIGINNKEAVALALSPAMRGVSWLFFPVVHVFEAAVKKLMRMGRNRLKGEAAVGNPEFLELRAAVALARATSTIGPMEEKILISAAQLSTRHLVDAMVPARDIAMIPADMNLSEALIEAHIHMRTRYPVCTEAGNPQTISGYVTFKDIIAALKVDPSGSGLHGIIRPIRRMDTRTTLAQALSDMMQDRIHIALVNNETGVQGMITTDDIVEELIGDIRDEYDHLPAYLHPIGEGWLAGGGVLVKDLAAKIPGTAFSDEISRRTLAEWVDHVHGSPVRSGDTIRSGGVSLVVRKVRRNRVSEAVVRPWAGEAGKKS